MARFFELPIMVSLSFREDVTVEKSVYFSFIAMLLSLDYLSAATCLGYIQRLPEKQRMTLFWDNDRCKVTICFIEGCLSGLQCRYL